MPRTFYSDTIEYFLNADNEFILGQMTQANQFALEIDQRDSWSQEIQIFKEILLKYKGHSGKIFMEFTIPRMGLRADTLLLIDGILFVLEFKLGNQTSTQASIDQVYDYALDLKNFHETSHELPIIPVLIPHIRPS